MEYVKTSVSVIGTVLLYLVGGYDTSIKLLLVAMFLDYLTGILRSIRKRNISSEIGLKGIVRKCYLLCLVGLSVIVDEITGNSGIVRNSMIYYIIANEGISIIENASEFNFFVPKILRDRLEKIKNIEGDDKIE